MDFGGLTDDMKSTLGYIFILVRGAKSSKNVKQTITASSTILAEFISCHEVTSQVIWLRTFLWVTSDRFNVTFDKLCDDDTIFVYSKK